jgi:DNA-binding transcriptional ArsR family regulator
VDGPRVVVQPGTGYDLLLSACLVASTTGRRVEAWTTWRGRADAVRSGELTRSVERIGKEPWINLLGFIHARTDEPSAVNAVAAIEAAEPRDLVLAAVGYQRRAMRLVTSPAVIRAAVDGDRAAIDEFRRTSYPDLRHWQATLRELLGAPAATVGRRFVETVRAWFEDVFAEHEPAIAAAQAADASIVRELVASVELDAVLERITPGLTFAREIGQEVLVLAPSTILPGAVALADYGPALVIAYPAGGATELDDVPPDQLVRLAKALADPLRLRALRELRDGPMSATELARRLGVPRTSLHHHVRVLLEAGVARLSVDDARTGSLELWPRALTDVSRLAERWVLGREGLAPSEAEGPRPLDD